MSTPSPAAAPTDPGPRPAPGSVPPEAPAAGRTEARRRSARRSKAFRVARAVAVPAALAIVATAAAPGFTTVRVHQGDTLWGLARTHHTTVDDIRRLNHIDLGSDMILIGQVLRLPGNAPAAPTVRMVARSTAAGTPAPPASGAARTVTHTVTYVVRPGDTLIAVAARYRVGVAALAARNHLPASRMIMIGQRLAFEVTVAAPAVVPANPGGRHYPDAVVASAARHRAAMAHRTVPSRAAVRSMIVATARRMGLDPALALAVAYQESGFNQHVVSGADAIGTMQVLPGTGEFVGTYLVGRRLDLLDTQDNITAGVGLLRSLTRAAPVGQAVAGYYQGLGSVRSRGMFADTKQYVANVLSLRRHFAG